MQILENDPRVRAEMVTFKGGSGEVKGYLVRPANAARAPAVVIIHENKGLAPYVKDVARRAAAQGFIALAPDFLSQVGGTPQDEAEGPEKTRTLDMAKTKQDAIAAAEYLRTHSGSNGKVGSIGFCWGGALSNQLAVNDLKLDAAVVFYGRSPATEDVAKIRAKMLLHYGSLDENINKTVPAYEAALKAQGKSYTLNMYEGAQHAFHNNDNPSRHHPENAALAWDRTMAFLKDTLAA
jgi:carboxymethylenebutenolidase